MPGRPRPGLGRLGLLNGVVEGEWQSDFSAQGYAWPSGVYDLIPAVAAPDFGTFIDEDWVTSNRTQNCTHNLQYMGQAVYEMFGSASPQTKGTPSPTRRSTRSPCFNRQDGAELQPALAVTATVTA